MLMIGSSFRLLGPGQKKLFVLNVIYQLPIGFYFIVHHNFLSKHFRFLFTVCTHTLSYILCTYIQFVVIPKKIRFQASHFFPPWLYSFPFHSTSIYAFPAPSHCLYIFWIYCSALPWGVGPPVGGEQWERPRRCSTTGLVLLWTHGRAQSFDT